MGNSENNNQIVNMENKSKIENYSNSKRNIQNSGSEIMQLYSQTQPSIDNTATNVRTATSDEGKCNEHQKYLFLQNQ